VGWEHKEKVDKHASQKGRELDLSKYKPLNLMIVFLIKI